MYRLIDNKHILLGVTGGIAAYKSATLIRLLRRHGAEVRVVMTPNATKFITPLTLQALSGNPVHVELMGVTSESAMVHIDLARWADLVIVAPASAGFIARYAHGFADDLPGSICLATMSPVMIAPAMNRQMWLNPATQENLRRVKAFGVRILGPAEGDQACGENGPGRMLEPEELAERVVESFQPYSLAGIRLMVTAGPTREAIDPVRFISNRSSGHMGYAIAEVASEAGADVSVISGPVKLPLPERVKITRVVSAEEMYESVMRQIDGIDIFIATAAVADYRPQSTSRGKIKKQAPRLELTLVKNPDILGAVAALDRTPFTVGFAAETENLEANARIKLDEKKLDMIVANKVGEGLGFETSINALTIIWKDGQKRLAEAPKGKLARDLIRFVADRYHAKRTSYIH